MTISPNNLISPYPIIVLGAGEPVKRGLSSGSPQGAAGLRHKNWGGTFQVSRNLLNLGFRFQLLDETVGDFSKAFHQFLSFVVGCSPEQPSEGESLCPNQGGTNPHQNGMKR